MSMVSFEPKIMIDVSKVVGQTGKVNEERVRKLEREKKGQKMEKYGRIIRE